MIVRMKPAIFAGHAAIPRAPGISDGLYDGSLFDILLPLEYYIVQMELW